MRFFTYYSKSLKNKLELKIDILEDFPNQEEVTLYGGPSQSKVDIVIS